MALVHETTIRNGLADFVVDAIDAGVGANGRIEFQTSADVEVATLAFDATAFGNAVNGTATANPIITDTNATGGVVAKFVIYDEPTTAGNVILSGTVTAIGGGGDIELTSTLIAPGDSVAIDALTYTASA
jgi:hypothetical protein